MTPLMQQWSAVKSQHLDKIVAFRMGDFFEFFNEDAEKVAPAIGIQLTQRNKKSNDNTPMCGVPHFSLPDIATKLLAKGFRLAICDQVEDPKFAKGLVKREVTRVLTPGMVYDPLSLKPTDANFMMSFDDEQIAFLDATTGEGFYYSRSKETSVEGLIKILRPVEIVFPRQISDHLKVSLEIETKEFVNKVVWFDFAESTTATERLVEYARKTLGGKFELVAPFEERFWNQRLILSELALKHLEVLESLHKDGVSLFESLNGTKTAAGARLFKSWLMFPLVDSAKIEQRQDEVESFVYDFELTKKVRQRLAQLNDLQRLLGKLSMSQAQPRDLLQLLEALTVGFEIEDFFAQAKNDLQLQNLKKLTFETQELLEPNLEKWNDQYGYIRARKNSALDELIELTENSKAKLLALEVRLKAETQISSLKVGYNSVFGYYIEVSKANSAKVPSYFVRKQTLTNGERYIIDELKDLEVQILSASSKRQELEKQIFNELKHNILSKAAFINLFARKWAHLDVVTNLAWIAIERQYVRPVLSGSRIELEQSRHPVVERLTKFSGNDVGQERGEVMLLTGPNMAGKSTLMRQVALIALLAQIGAFVPAKKATLPLFDQIFTRIGSSDSLAEGHSTFMVEMLETASLLKSATTKSLILLDEIGRGTSTFDGLSLAQSLLEHLLTSLKCITLFATHYHELTTLGQAHANLKNCHMAISEANGQLKFLYLLKSGAAQKSYGIHVASLAGVPPHIILRAKEILKVLEQQSQPLQLDLSMWHQSSQVLEKRDEMSELVKRLNEITPDQCTPVQALNLLYELKRLV